MNVQLQNNLVLKLYTSNSNRLDNFLTKYKENLPIKSEKVLWKKMQFNSENNEHILAN